MLKNLYLLLIAASISGTMLSADVATATPPEKKATSASKVSAGETSTEETAAEPAPEKPLKVLESELIEMVGFLTAQGGGVPLLELDEAGVNALAAGIVQGLSGEKQIEDFSDEEIQEAINNVELRIKAIEAESDTVPEVDEEDLNTIGFVMVMQSGLIQLGFGAEEAPLIKKGFIEGANVTEQEPPSEAKLSAFQEFIQKRVAMAQSKAAAMEEALRAERQAASKVFFEELASDPTIQKSESGLYYKIIKPGADQKPTLEDTVLVHYKGTLIDGTVFDSSYDRGSPAKFPLNGVVKGFGEGLTKIGAGGKIILYIPSELGYGDNPRPGGLIKPGDALIFECELIELNP